MTSAKESRLIEIIKSLHSAVIGLSGGVDSTLIAKLCKDHLGAENIWVVTGESESIMPEELEYCREMAVYLQLPPGHFVTIKTDELADPNSERRQALPPDTHLEIAHLQAPDVFRRLLERLLA